MVEIYIQAYKYFFKKDKKEKTSCHSRHIYTHIYMHSLQVAIMSLPLFLFLFSFKKNRSCWNAKPPFSESPHPSLCACSPWGWIMCECLQKGQYNHELEGNQGQNHSYEQESHCKFEACLITMETPHQTVLHWNVIDEQKLNHNIKKQCCKDRYKQISDWFRARACPWYVWIAQYYSRLASNVTFRHHFSLWLLSLLFIKWLVTPGTPAIYSEAMYLFISLSFQMAKWGQNPMSHVMMFSESCILCNEVTV